MFKRNDYVKVTLPGGEKVKGIIREALDNGRYTVYIYRIKRQIEANESSIQLYEP